MNATAPTTARILSYQRERTLDRVPAYRMGLQVRLGTGQSVYVAVSNTELALYFDEPDRGIHYDLEGRLIRVSGPDEYRRRSLSHRVLFSRKLTREEGGGLSRTVLTVGAANGLVTESNALARQAWDGLQARTAKIEFAKPSAGEAARLIAPFLKRAADFDATAAAADAQRFRELYGRVAVLPPDQYNALVLQATQGCAHAGCLFCELYGDVSYRRKTPAQFRQHVREAIAWHGEGLRARRSIFLGEANALALPQPELVEMFQVLHEHFELPDPGQVKTPATWWMGSANRFDGIGSFMDAFKHSRRTADDFAELRQLGLRRVYIGLETGDDGLLRWLRKPASAETVARYAGALKQADIAVGLIVLLGAGGVAFADSHVRETARVLNELKLDARDYIYFSPLMVAPGGRYAARTGAQGAAHFTDEQMRSQEQAIRARLRFDAGRGRPYLAHYELEHFVY